MIGAGPNGLAAAITLAKAGLAVTLTERNAWAGGACATRELTLPGFRHDLGASVFPMGAASPFLRGLGVDLPWVEPPACCAHPLDDGSAVMLERTLADTAAQLDADDRAAYRTLLEPVSERFLELAEDLLGPVLHLPRHPLLMAKLGLRVALPATALARARFSGVRARALLAGMAAHAVMPLEAPASSAVALVLMAAGHSVGWPIARGGSQALTDVLVERFEQLGGKLELSREVTELPEGLVLADVTPRQMLRLAQGRLPDFYRSRLEAFRYGAGAFKVDYALSQPIPWTAPECLRAATVHVGGTIEDVAASERHFQSDRPFVLLVQPSLFDSARAPAGRHTAWAYCHVPHGSGEDVLGKLERQIERFAPGFGECVLERRVWGPAALEAWNPSLVGGDLGGGEMSVDQMVFRPTGSLYRTAAPGVYFCGSSTPPGGGVHGMAGFHAASTALADLG